MKGTMCQVCSRGVGTVDDCVYVWRDWMPTLCADCYDLLELRAADVCAAIVKELTK